MSQDRGADSPVVTTTVRLVAPFVMTFALFTLFHGTVSAGGGFQGGVVAAATVVMLAFGLGIRDTVAWLSDGRILALAVAAPLVFGAVALAGVVVGDAFLGFARLPIPKPSVYATELIELGIGASVAAVVVVLFVNLAAPYAPGCRFEGASGASSRPVRDSTEDSP
ncbi:MAG: MnhB domain-containing protein [Haloferacaceae archaeon]